MKHSISRALFIIFCLFVFACNSDYTQKPRGYFKVDLPPKSYQKFDQPGYPYSFEFPTYGHIIKDSLFFDQQAENPYWINIDFPQFNGRIHISYKEIGKNKFDSLVNDAYTLSYKQHTYRASAIQPAPFTTPSGVEGVFFTLKGNAATTSQFFERRLTAPHQYFAMEVNSFILSGLINIPLISHNAAYLLLPLLKVKL